MTAGNVPNDAGGVLLGTVRGNGAVSLLSGGDDQLLVVRNLNGTWRVSALEGNGVDTPFVSRTWVESAGQVVGEPMLDASGLHLTVMQASPAAAARSAAEGEELGAEEGEAAQHEPTGDASSVLLQTIVAGDRIVGLAP